MPNAAPTRSTLPRSLVLVRARWLVPLLLSASMACAAKVEVTTEAPTPPTPAAKEVQTDKEMQARLALLAERLEAARVQHHIPGMAVAVVKNDKIIFARGFGMADMEDKREATALSVFAVGSTTKAFTSAMVAMQVDAGAMAWDDPLTKHVPEMKLKTRPAKEGEDAEATIRDVLCHRTGFTRMSVLWGSGELSLDEVLAKASNAEPIADFRENFHYNNVTYASAGAAAARTSDTTWAEMLQSRIFEPLGMGHSTVTVAGAAADKHLAQGYRWREVSERHEALPMRSIDSAAPAGAINSNVLDMAQWLRLQLGRGTYDGKELISAKSLEQTWSPQIKVGGGIEYGLGWMLGDWQGHRVVEHGGNIDGYAAQVGMLPDDNIGFVLLTNISATPLQRGSLGIVFESLLGELPSDDAEAPATEDLSPYPAKYLADFGPFKDTKFIITAKGNTLFVDVPGQTNYELKAPDKDGRRSFALTDTIQVYFDLNEDKSKAQVLHMVQGGMDFELPREGYSFPPDVTAEEVADLLGRYEAEGGKMGVTIAIKQGRLVADVDGQMAYPLRKPGEDGRWQFRATDKIAVSFRRTAAGKVDAIVMHQGGNDQPLLRTKASTKPLPTVAQLLRRGKAKAADGMLAKLGPVELRGKVRMPSSAVDGTFILTFDATGRARLQLDLGRHGTMVESWDGKEAWSVSSISVPTQAEGKYILQAQLSSPLLIGDWTRGFTDIRVEGRSEHDDKEFIEVVLGADPLPDRRYFVEAKTGRVARTESAILVEGVGTIASTAELSDYRRVMGLQIPHRLTNENVHSGATIFEVETVTKAEGDPATLFAHTLTR